MTKPHESANELPALDLTSKSLTALAEKTRASLQDQIHALSAEFEPSRLANTAQQAASESLDVFVNAILQKPWRAAGGIAVAGVVIGVIQWRRHLPPTENAPKSDADPPQEDHLEEKSPRVPALMKRGDAKIGDLLTLASKLAVTLVSGYLLERAIPRKPGEMMLWNNARNVLLTSARDLSRDKIAGHALSPSSTLPWLALAMIAGRHVMMR